MVRFEDALPPATEAQIQQAEQRVGLRFPQPLKWLFLHGNGGAPDPCVFPSPIGMLVVNACLAVGTGRGSADDICERLRAGATTRPASFFPFAYDPSGNYFFVDAADPAAPVYFEVRDSADPKEIVPLNVTLEEFWGKLLPESRALG